MRHRFVYAILLLLRRLCRVFYRFDYHWVGDVPSVPWQPYHLVAILNHTSLFEFLFAGGVPRSFLRRLARHGVVPIASKTMDRPLVGLFWRFIAGNVVSISRERDETWEQVLSSIDPNSMVVILPEGRMKRADGLDAHGKPLSIRGGVAEIIEAMPEGRLLLAYSTGLHHIQVPGQRLPKLWKTVSLRLEGLDIPEYRASLRAERRDPDDRRAFRRAVVADLTARRDRYCAADFDLSSAVPDDSVAK